ncbi:MAG: EFR1 family ferrodoxin [Anaerolineaceae bacterium]|nr:EFR1 family ferrodoxin [Anaerolineaceae bacterium]
MERIQVPIFYFSGTGNTWWVGEKIAEGLRLRGYQAQAISIEQLDHQTVLQRVAEAETIGIGYPIYGSDAPRLMHDFIRALPWLTEKKQVFIYVTQMAWSGDGAYFLRRQLEEKNYELRWAVEFNMPNNISFPFPFPYTNDYTAFTRKLEKRSQQVDQLCERIAENQPWLQGNSLLSAAAAWIQRAPFRLLHQWCQKITWSIDESSCSRCGRCARNCPADNIRMEGGSFPTFGDRCVYCLRCYNYCPENAVKVYGARINQEKHGKPYQGPVPDFKPELIARKKNRE